MKHLANTITLAVLLLLATTAVWFRWGGFSNEIGTLLVALADIIIVDGLIIEVKRK